jgi:hypothetical protein
MPGLMDFTRLISSIIHALTVPSHISPRKEVLAIVVNALDQQGHGETVVK